MKKDLPKAYEPSQYEDKIYTKWEKSGYFNPDSCVKDGITKKNAASYSIVMPPPNVTGELHMGSAMMLAIEDTLIRYHRMKGEKTLWLPGTDHAAIATQTRVEKNLGKEGLDRHVLGREKFLMRVEEFAKNSKKTIINQTKKMGSSCDWSREAYTLDKTRTKAVRSVFKLMYDDGLIYRGDRVVNWCPRCHSTLADDEVEYKTQQAKLYTFKYDKDFPFTIATTRPETKLGDTAVAVNSKDRRYKKYINQTYEIDFAGVPLKLKIIADKGVDMEFGTGALGVTPAHSMIDWQMAQENNLEIIKVINEDGNIQEGFSIYSNKTVTKAREMIVKRLREQGLLKKEEDIENNLSLCYRCNTPIEPLPSLQWFINVNKKIPKYNKSIKELSIEAVKSGVFGRDKIKIVPKRFEKNYFHWMENLRDWCISRQIWFGHRVPVWYKKKEKTRLLLVRHGQTDWNKKGIMQGQKDIPLNEKGEKDALRFRKKIEKEKFDLIITSPLERTSKTSKILNVFKVKIIEDDRLKERSYGKFEGKKTDEILAQHPEIKTFEVNGLPYWINVPTAETYDQVKARVKDFLKDIKKKYAGKRILVVSHGDTLDMFYAVLNNVSNEQAYGKFSLNIRLEKYEIGSEEIYVGIEPPKDKNWIQDEDTLDTWFSSGLWTFSTLAREADQVKIKDNKLVIDSDDFKTYHPTYVLETMYDILFFWVARMIIMTTYAVRDIPFQDVYLHGCVRDEYGDKMSKSKPETCIDPIDVCEKYGTDAVRLSLIIGTTPGNDMNLSEEKIAGLKNFTNKLWNIFRYIQLSVVLNKALKHDSGDFRLEDKWILNKLERLVQGITDDFDNYRFSQAGENLREFTWSDFADWYIEAVKMKNRLGVISNVSGKLLRLWHPFMPFVTEVIYSQFFSNVDSDKNKRDLLMVQSWPRRGDVLVRSGMFDKEEKDFEVIKNIIIAIRNTRSVYGIKPSEKIKALIYAGNKLKLIQRQVELIKRLRTGIAELEIKKIGEKRKDAIYLTVDNIEIYLEVPGFDFKAEIKRIEKKIKEQNERVKALKKKLSNKQFIDKAPEKIVQQEKEKLESWQEELKKLKEQVSNLR